jgi:hypothetical protein
MAMRFFFRPLCNLMMVWIFSFLIINAFPPAIDMSALMDGVNGAVQRSLLQGVCGGSSGPGRWDLRPLVG